MLWSHDLQTLAHPKCLAFKLTFKNKLTKECVLVSSLATQVDVHKSGNHPKEHLCPYLWRSIYENKIEELPILHQLLTSSNYFSSIACSLQQPTVDQNMKQREWRLNLVEVVLLKDSRASNASYILLIISQVQQIANNFKKCSHKWIMLKWII
jgi:hypothetical protein